MKKLSKNNIITIALIIAIYAIVFVLEKVIDTNSMLFIVLKKGAIYALVAVSMNLLNGFTGLFSLGQAGFMLIGAYTYAIFTIPVEYRDAVYQYFDLRLYWRASRRRSSPSSSAFRCCGSRATISR